MVFSNSVACETACVCSAGVSPSASISPEASWRMAALLLLPAVRNHAAASIRPAGSLSAARPVQSMAVGSPWWAAFLAHITASCGSAGTPLPVRRRVASSLCAKAPPFSAASRSDSRLVGGLSELLERAAATWGSCFTSLASLAGDFREHPAQRIKRTTEQATDLRMYMLEQSITHTPYQSVFESRHAPVPLPRSAPKVRWVKVAWDSGAPALEHFSQICSRCNQW